MLKYFNPRPRKEGDDTPCKFLLLENDFNPRPRKEGDIQSALDGGLCLWISIHALAKRATQLLTLARCQMWISIHALAKRATKEVFKMAYIAHFNPRPRKEGDLRLAYRPHCRCVFQSTPSQRGRQKPLYIVLQRREFQSTPSQRGRQITVVQVSLYRHFNPRPRKEGD